MEKKEGKQSVRGRIISAAWELFRDKGFGRTTVDDIIERSGTSKGSFYYYFDTKDELLNTLSVVLDDYYEELESRMSQETDCFEKLLYLNREVHAMMEEKISIELLASLYSTQLIAKGESQLLDANRKYYKLIFRIVEEGQKRGEIRGDLSIQDIVKYYSMCERALVSDWCLSKGSYSLAEYSRAIMPIMMEHFRGNK